MLGKTEVTGSTSAQLRGDIQVGLARGKRPGFDPAIATIETDAEAGGVALQAADADCSEKHSDLGRNRRFPPLEAQCDPCFRVSALTIHCSAPWSGLPGGHLLHDTRYDLPAQELNSLVIGFRIRWKRGVAMVPAWFNPTTFFPYVGPYSTFSHNAEIHSER